MQREAAVISINPGLAARRAKELIDNYGLSRAMILSLYMDGDTRRQLSKIHRNSNMLIDAWHGC